MPYEAGLPDQFGRSSSRRLMSIRSGQELASDLSKTLVEWRLTFQFEINLLSSSKAKRRPSPGSKRGGVQWQKP